MRSLRRRRFPFSPSTIRRSVFAALALVCAVSVLEAAAPSENDGPAGVELPAIARIPPDALLPVVDRTAGIEPNDNAAIAAGLKRAEELSTTGLQAAAGQTMSELRQRDPVTFSASPTAAVIAELLRDPERRRGLPYTVAGYVQGVSRRPAPQNDLGLAELFEVRLFTAASQTAPVIVLAAALSENFPESERAVDDVSVSGFFVKLIESPPVEGGEAAGTVSPVLVTDRLIWEPLLTDRDTVIPAEILADVKDKTGGIRPSEADAYYRILHHASRGNLRLQRLAGRSNRTERIARYEQEVRDKYANFVREQKKKPAPDLAALERERRRLEMRLRDHRKFVDNPESFPTFIDLFQDAEPYRGRIVTLRGHIRKLIEYPAGKNRYGLEKLYEAWLYTSDSQLHPCVVVFTELPAAHRDPSGNPMQIPLGEDILEEVSVNGYFFKLYGYDAYDATRFAPLFLARTLDWHPRHDEFAGMPPLGYYLLALAGVAAIVWSLRRVSRRDKAIRERRLHADLEAAGNADFETILANTGDIEPDFSKITATNDGPDFTHFGAADGEPLANAPDLGDSISGGANEIPANDDRADDPPRAE